MELYNNLSIFVELDTHSVCYEVPIWFVLPGKE